MYDPFFPSAFSIVELALEMLMLLLAVWQNCAMLHHCIWINDAKILWITLDVVWIHFFFKKCLSFLTHTHTSLQLTTTHTQTHTFMSFSLWGTHTQTHTHQQQWLCPRGPVFKHVTLSLKAEAGRDDQVIWPLPYRGRGGQSPKVCVSERHPCQLSLEAGEAHTHTRNKIWWYMSMEKSIRPRED